MTTIKPSKENIAKFVRRYWHRPIRWRSAGRSLPMRKFERDIRSWFAAFPLCDQTKMWWLRASLLGNLRSIMACPPDIVRGYARLLDGRDGV